VNQAAAFSRIQTGAVIAMAIVAGCLPALLPILLGGLLDEHRISSDQIGHAATAEALGRVVATVLAGALLRPVHLRAIVAMAALVMIVTNGATLYLGIGGILAARFLNGAAAGMILWVLVGLLARASQPGRLFAIYVTMLSVVTFLLSSLIMLLLPKWGVASGYVVLMLIGIVPLILSSFIPGEYPRLVQAGISQRPNAQGLVGLCAVTLFMAGVFAIWVYIGPLAKQLGHPAGQVHHAISVALGLQIFGGLAATRLADRWDGAVTTALASMLAAASVFLLLFMPQPWALYVSISLIALAWMFTPSFHLPMILGFDPSGRSAIFISTAQLGGIALGPLIASSLIGANDFRGAVMASIGAFACCVLLLGILGSSRAQSRTG